MLKNSQRAQTTITRNSKKFSGIYLTRIFLIFFLASVAGKAETSKEKWLRINSESCTTQYTQRLSVELARYLKRPSSVDAQDLALRLCRSAPEGPKPCPIAISEAQVSDFEKISENNLGVIAVIACAAKISSGAITEEFNELQMKLLDKNKKHFFEGWAMIPSQVKPYSQKFDEFAQLSPDVDDSFQKKVRGFQERTRVLESAPARYKNEVASSLTYLNNTITEAREEGLLSDQKEADVVLISSNFRQQLLDKMIRITADDNARATTLANQTFLSTGLNYKVYFKSDDRKWNICSTATQSTEGCQMSHVSIPEGFDSCGRYGILKVLLQAGGLWIVSSEKSNFRINAPEYFTPQAVLLMKSDSLVRFWNIPYGFEPKFLSSDLRNLFVSTVLKSNAGRRLAELYLQIRENQKVQFTDIPTNSMKVISLDEKASISVKGPDSNMYQVTLTKNCR